MLLGRYYYYLHVTNEESKVIQKEALGQDPTLAQLTENSMLTMTTYHRDGAGGLRAVSRTPSPREGSRAWPRPPWQTWRACGLFLYCCALLQGIFPTQGSNPGLLHCRWILYRLIHQGSPVGSRHSQRLQPSHCTFLGGGGICEPILALPSLEGFPHFPTSISQASEDLLRCHRET